MGQIEIIKSGDADIATLRTGWEIPRHKPSKKEKGGGEVRGIVTSGRRPRRPQREVIQYKTDAGGGDKYLKHSVTNEHTDFVRKNRGPADRITPT